MNSHFNDLPTGMTELDEREMQSVVGGTTCGLLALAVGSAAGIAGGILGGPAGGLGGFVLGTQATSYLCSN